MPPTSVLGLDERAGRRVMTAPHNRLAVDLSSAGVARLALVMPGYTVLDGIATYSDRDFSTITEVFQNFERDRNVSLSDSEVAIAIAGVATGSTVPIVRSRWTLSREGLDRYFGRRVTIVNEVAAKAWSVFGSASHEARSVTGSGALSPTRAGRWVFVSLADGLGIAVIDITADGGRRVLETEAGHGSMTVVDEIDDAIVARLRRQGRFPSWENALDVLGLRGSPEFGDQPPAHYLGTLAADLVYTFAAWDGVVLADRAADLVRTPREIAAFSAAPRLKRPYDRLLTRVPTWALTSQNAALRGCAIMLE